MKYQCDIPGLEDCFVEFSDQWSRKQARDFFEAKDDVYLDLVQSKIIDSRLDCPDGEPVTGQFRLDAETLDRIDFRLVIWLSTMPLVHVQSLGSLGEALARRSFVSTETSQAEAAPTQ